MTIRYTCSGCESVLKIKDEKAGTKAKCPKCRQEFVVPQPDADGDAPLSLDAEADAPADIPVDMPLDLTPEVQTTDDFDPADFLSSSQTSTSSSSVGAASSGSSGVMPGGRKPSVAELMKDFEATKKKDKDKDKGKKSGEVSRPSGSADETSGTASDLLAKAYQQKRNTASAPQVSAKDAKAAEERALLQEFLFKRGIPGLAIIAAITYGLYAYSTAETYTGPPLYDVTGTVMKSGKPLANVRVDFGPDPDALGAEPYSASGVTNAEGRYELSFTGNKTGAPAGKYAVGLTDEAGAPLSVVEDEVRREVRTTGPNQFDFNL